MDKKEHALKKHAEWAGKLEITSRAELAGMDDLAVAYTPGVAEPCLAIKDDVDLSYTYTRRHNLVAVVTDGTAVLGLGDIGPEAGMPVMEGKCVLFKEFAGVDAFPLCIRSKDVDEIVRTVSLLAGSFGGINLEDIAAPRCFEIERKLKQCCDIPVFHDDQHGTAVVCLAAVINGLKVVGKKLESAKLVINGAGSAGIAIGKMFLSAGVGELIMVDREGALYDGMESGNPAHLEIAAMTNSAKQKGKLGDVIKDADIFIGVSAPGALSGEMVESMAPGAIVLAMANPVPEIMPEEALRHGAAVVGTGRSDYPNQINNVLAFPGIFRGALDVRASDITEEMKLAAAYAIASVIPDSELTSERIIPDAFDKRVAKSVAAAVAAAAKECGVARI